MKKTNNEKTNNEKTNEKKTEVQYFSSRFTREGTEHLFFFVFEGIRYQITKTKLFNEKTRHRIKTQWFDKKLKKLKSKMRSVTHLDKKERIVTAFKQAVKDAGIKLDRYKPKIVTKYRKLAEKQGVVSRIDY